MRRFFFLATKNPISLLGVAITTATAVLMLALLGMEWAAGHGGNPYLGILNYVILPGIFFMGLVLIPIGISWERRRQRRGLTGDMFPVLDLNNATTRRLILTFLVLTLVNVIILSAATYKSIEVMESVEFCGTTCHTVMEPEHTAYQGSPHAKVKCVECHIGPGAGWFVKSKLSGAWQLVSVTFNLYSRPIATPIHNLRPARETCEQCHWPTKFVGDRLWVKTHYDQDEENTELKTVLVLRVGGMEGRKSHGIHWHVDPGIQVRYRSDESRENIYDVEYTTEDGEVHLFKSGETPEEGEGAAGDWRIMDCIDCHNRPTHIFRMPGNEIDRALQTGEIDRSLPYVRREGLRLLRDEYASTQEAGEQITQSLTGYYRENYPEVATSEAEAIQEAATVLTTIHNRNVFPEMKVGWGTYPSHLGHTDFPGCFRCHDDEHATEDGETISQDCSTCHTLLAMEEENPEVLDMLQP
jgi:hypothetical protein